MEIILDEVWKSLIEVALIITESVDVAVEVGVTRSMELVEAVVGTSKEEEGMGVEGKLSVEDAGA